MERGAERPSDQVAASSPVDAASAWQPGIPSVREYLPSLVFGAALPIGVYFIVRRHVQTDTAALIVAGCFSVAWILLQFARQRTVDVVGLAVLVGFVAGVVTSTLLGGNAYVLKVRDGFFTLLFGVACIVTLYTHDRPALFYVSRYLSAGKDPVKVSAFDRLHDVPLGRHTFRTLSVVWGVGLVVEASSRLTLAELLPTGTFIAVSPFITASVIGSLFAFTAVYTKRTQFWSAASSSRPRIPVPAIRAGPPRRFRRRPDRGGSDPTARLSLGGDEGSPPMADEVLRERQGHVEILTINRPEARNAINGAVSRAMSAAMDELTDDPDCWVVVVTGSGDKAFSAGMDLKAFSSGEGGDIMGASGGFGGVTQREFPKPLIAAVNGSALAGGFEIMLSCDLVVAADHATFGIPEAKRGLIAGAGGLIRMPKRLPLAVALELAMTGDPISAARAYELGLVNRVVPSSVVLEEAVSLADRIAANAPLAVRYSKSVMKQAAEVSEAEGWKINGAAVGVVFSSADAMEGPVAFAEKRPPNWQGK